LAITEKQEKAAEENLRQQRAALLRMKNESKKSATKLENQLNQHIQENSEKVNVLREELNIAKKKLGNKRTCTKIDTR